MTRKSPRRYFSGLSKSATRRRRSEIAKFGSMGSRNRRAYVGFQTDKGRRTRRSKYGALDQGLPEGEEPGGARGGQRRPRALLAAVL